MLQRPSSQFLRVLRHCHSALQGFAYVLYHLPEDAVKAFRELDMTIFQGRLVHILPARKLPESEAKPGEGDAQDDGTGGSFKKQREDQRKADAGNRAAWNTLFMRADTVAEAVAAYYGVSKSELLDRDATDLPVRACTNNISLGAKIGYA